MRREPTFVIPRLNMDVRLSQRDRTVTSSGNDDTPRTKQKRTDPKRLTRNAKRSARGGGRQGGDGDGNGSGRRRSRAGRAIYWFLVLCLWGAIAGIGGIFWIGAHLPPIQSLEVPKRPPSIQIVGIDGRVLVTRGDSGVSANLKDLPPYLPQAFIAIEDRRFYSHHGIDPLGIARAVLANVLRRGVAQGGSTLTQQLAKNLFLTQERTISRKLQELALALWLERKFTKAEILDLYLNRVYFGAGAYGVEAAAQRYFGKSAQKVTIAEAAMLAGLVKSPSRLAPNRNPEGATKRAQVVIAAMEDMGFLSDAKAKLAMKQPAHALQQHNSGSVNYIADWIMDVLDERIGHVDDDIVVETTIDPVLQASGEKALVEELAQKGEKFNVGQGALVAMSPDGAVRALVGGRDYAQSQFNRAVAAKRQPGSAFKPFVYLTAIERGLTPDTIREDKPIALKGWKPENYTHEYFGPVTLTQALAMSLNTVSVRLTLEFGPNAVVRTAHRLGIASKLEANPSIALGTSEVSLMELVSAFAPFSNDGMSVTPHVVESIYRKDGTLLYQRPSDNPASVIEPRYVAMMNTMMQETLLTGTARKAELPGWQAAGKTGTSQDFRDAWFIGYTAHLVAGIWLGNDDNTPTKKTTGGGLPAEIWSRFMKAAHRNVAVAALPGSTMNNFAPFGNASNNPAPRAQNGNGQRPQPIQANARGGLDSWFLDRLFGRRN